jgi:hypothetical protein
MPVKSFSHPHGFPEEHRGYTRYLEGGLCNRGYNYAAPTILVAPAPTAISFCSRAFQSIASRIKHSSWLSSRVATIGCTGLNYPRKWCCTRILFCSGLARMSELRKSAEISTGTQR